MTDRAGNAGGRDVEIGVGKTTSAELVKTVDIGKSQSDANKVIVLQLGPSQLPDLKPGDRLMTPCELELTTAADVGQGGYDPKVKVTIVLGDANDKQGKQLAQKEGELSRQRHHEMFVFGKETAKQLGKKDIPKKPHVNVVLQAWHPSAGNGKVDQVIVGANEGDFLNGNKPPEGDKARLMALRERGNVNPDGEQSKEGKDQKLTQNEQDVVIHSHELEGKAGETYYAEAKVSATSNLRARFSTKLQLANSAGSTNGGGYQNADPGQISENNGTNIPAGGKETTNKVAVFTLKKDGKVFINVIAVKDTPGGGSATVTVKDTQMKVDRYAK